MHVAFAAFFFFFHYLLDYEDMLKFTIKYLKSKHNIQA